MEPRQEVREEAERGRRRGEGEGEEGDEDLQCKVLDSREGGKEVECPSSVWAQCKRSSLTLQARWEQRDKWCSML